MALAPKVDSTYFTHNGCFHAYESTPANNFSRFSYLSPETLRWHVHCRSTLACLHVDLVAQKPAPQGEEVSHGDEGQYASLTCALQRPRPTSQVCHIFEKHLALSNRVSDANLDRCLEIWPPFPGLGLRLPSSVVLAHTHRDQK